MTNIQVTYAAQDNKGITLTEKNNKPVTSSREVALNFDKRHDNVIRDIEQMKKDVLNFEEMFYETTMPDSYGRKQKVYLVNRDGFTLLAVGFTGKKALKFKLDYIAAFNAMEEKLKQNIPTDPLQLALHSAIENAKRIDTVEEKLEYFNEFMRLSTLQERTLQMNMKHKVIKVCDGYKSPLYNKVSSKVFRAAWKEFNNYFELPVYRALPASKYEEALKFINMWQPSTSLALDIENEKESL